MIRSNLNTVGPHSANKSPASQQFRDARRSLSPQKERAFSPQRERAVSPERGGSASAESSMYLPMDRSLVQKFQSQYSNYNKGSFGSQLPRMHSQYDNASPAGKPTFVLTLHFLGVSGISKASCFERAPAYEVIVHAGGVAKRFRPRIPAPPPGAGSDMSTVDLDLERCIPAEQLQTLQRLDDRLSVRLVSPGEFFRVDIWEERAPFLDFGSKGPSRSLFGKCYIPLESKYNRRPCTWPIVLQAVDKGTLTEVGFLTCKFGLAGMPGAVRNLQVVEGTISEKEVQLAWDPPESDGGTPLRGYRVEARDASVEPNLVSSFMFGEDAPITSSAPPTQEPSAILRNLHGNTAYIFCVWAVSEAGPGTGSEVQGRTAAIPPRLCGPPYLVESSHGSGHLIQWSPPSDNGGADIVAYRVWLRPLFLNNIGEQRPGESWIDLGLSEHRGEQHVLQQTPLLLHALPSEGVGCLCSISALSAAGHLGPTTQEVPIFSRQSTSPIGSPDGKLVQGRFHDEVYSGRKRTLVDPFKKRLSTGSLAAAQLANNDNSDLFAPDS